MLAVLSDTAMAFCKATRTAQMWLSSSKLWTLASLSVAVHLRLFLKWATILPQNYHIESNHVKSKSSVQSLAQRQALKSPNSRLLQQTIASCPATQCSAQPWPTRGKQNLNLNMPRVQHGESCISLLKFCYHRMSISPSLNQKGKLLWKGNVNSKAICRGLSRAAVYM